MIPTKYISRSARFRSPRRFSILSRIRGNCAKTTPVTACRESTTTPVTAGRDSTTTPVTAGRDSTTTHVTARRDSSRGSSSRAIERMRQRSKMLEGDSSRPSAAGKRSDTMSDGDSCSDRNIPDSGSGESKSSPLSYNSSSDSISQPCKLGMLHSKTVHPIKINQDTKYNSNINTRRYCEKPNSSNGTDENTFETCKDTNFTSRTYSRILGDYSKRSRGTSRPNNNRSYSRQSNRRFYPRRYMSFGPDKKDECADNQDLPEEIGGKENEGKDLDIRDSERVPVKKCEENEDHSESSEESDGSDYSGEISRTDYESMSEEECKSAKNAYQTKQTDRRKYKYEDQQTYENDHEEQSNQGNIVGKHLKARRRKSNEECPEEGGKAKVKEYSSSVENDDVQEKKKTHKSGCRVPPARSQTTGVQTDEYLLADAVRERKYRHRNFQLNESPSRKRKTQGKKRHRRCKVLLPHQRSSFGSETGRVGPEISVKSLQVCAESPSRVRVKVKLRRSGSHDRQRVRTAKSRRPFPLKSKPSSQYHVKFIQDKYATPRERKVTRYLLSSHDVLPFIRKKLNKKQKKDAFLRRFEKEWAKELEIKRNAKRSLSRYKYEDFLGTYASMKRE